MTESRSKNQPGQRGGLPKLIAALVCLTGVVIYFVPAPAGAEAGVMKVAGVVIFAIGLWATAVIPEFLTAIIFFLLAVTLADVAPQTVFSGFHSTAAWMVFGGLVIGAAVHATGLGAAIARRLAGLFGKTYLGTIAGIVIVAAIMAFLVPSNTGRILILVPVFAALADRMGFAEGSPGRAALVLAAATGTLYPGFGILPAAVPNLVMLGAAESIHGIEVTYGRYLMLNFPVIGFVSIAVLPFLIRALFPDTPRPAGGMAVEARLGPKGGTLAAVLLVALGLWTTDFIHGLSPAWVALGAAVYCLLPKLGVLPPKALVERINLGPWFFIAGVVGMGAVVASGGLGDLVGQRLFAILRLTPGEHGANFAAVNAIGAVLGLLVTMPGQPAIMTALAANIADATGWPLATAVLAQIPSWAMALLPYELPPMIVAMYLGGIRGAQLVRLLAAMTLVLWIVVLPLQYLWWRHLGMFG